MPLTAADPAAELARFAEADHAAFSRKEDEMDEYQPTQWAYEQACKALNKHRIRGNTYRERAMILFRDARMVRSVRRIAHEITEAERDAAYAAGLSAAAAACATRAEQHAQAAEHLLPGSAATAFLDLRGEAAACARAIRALAGP